MEALTIASRQTPEVPTSLLVQHAGLLTGFRKPDLALGAALPACVFLGVLLALPWSDGACALVGGPRAGACEGAPKETQEGEGSKWKLLGSHSFLAYSGAIY